MLDVVKEFLEGCRYIEAVTYKSTAPHEYTLRKGNNQQLFDLALETIESHGTILKYYDYDYKYLILGDYYYFTGYRRKVQLWEVRLINRASLKAYSLIDGRWVWNETIHK